MPQHKAKKKQHLQHWEKQKHASNIFEKLRLTFK